MKKTLLAGLTLALLSTSALATDTQYGIGYRSLDLDAITTDTYYDESDSENFNLGALEISAEHALFNTNFGLEARVGVSVDDDGYTDRGESYTEKLTVDIESYAGVYVTYDYDVTSTVSVTPFVGMTRVDIKLSESYRDAYGTQGGRTNFASTDLSYGIGASWEFAPQWQVYADYTVLADDVTLVSFNSYDDIVKTSVDIDSWALGITRTF